MRKTWTRLGLPIVVAAAALLAHGALAADWKLIGWNDLGMHCMDADFAVFAILPPYNTIHAQLVDGNGQLVTNVAGITVTYEAVADPEGSFNSTSQGKTNFWDHVAVLFGASPPPDHGLAGFNMPGLPNTPQAMTFSTQNHWFTAEGIPLTPYDDSYTTDPASAKNYYPMMRLVARDSSGHELASTQIVLPVSDEMSCRACHASGSSSAAEPAAGWVWHADPERDYRLNILLLHDEYQLGNPLYASALAARGYNALGLYPTVTSDGTAVLCAGCHGSNALPGTGYAGIEPLTRAVHARHAGAVDPATGLTLGSSANRTACYTCHPGSETRCLRGAMGAAVAADGSLAMQCQSCHGGMAAVGDAARQGWFDEPACQSCHTGTATDNNGQIRFTSVFGSNGQPRVAVNSTFATNPDTPAPGISLYRFSTGHGGLQCEACHGSTHAVFPTSHVNDNIQSTLLQGHRGALAECSSCHGQQPQTTSGGPHGMHPVGQEWVSRHHDVAEHGGAAACRACHGADYRGTVLSYAQGDRTLQTEWGSKQLWRGFRVGCYNCHNGPSSESRNPNRAPVTASLAASTSAGVPVPVALVASDADGDTLELRIVSQSTHGTVGLTGTTATYHPEATFAGTDTFTYAAWDGDTDSNLSTVTVTVGPGACTVQCSATVPASATAGSSVSMTGSASPSGCAGAVSYAWDFGDGTPHASTASTSHTYASAGTYSWTFTATAGGVSCTKSGTITVSSPCTVQCSATVPASATTGSSVSMTGSASPSGCAGAVSYAWDFGDGTPHASTASTSHTYASAGTYSWTFTATANGVSCTKSGTITVSSPCTVQCSATVPASATTGSSVSMTGSASPSGCAGAVSYAWDFGDGTPHASTASTSHTYASAGTYSWTFTATANGVSCTKSGTITVSPASTCNLTCSAEVQSWAQRGESVEFHGHVETERCSGEPTVRWTFGDGSPIASGKEVRHRYERAGSFTWQMSASLSGATCSSAGSIRVVERRRDTVRP